MSEEFDPGVPGPAGMEHATPMGRDIDNKVLPHRVEAAGRVYMTVSHYEDANRSRWTISEIEALIATVDRGTMRGELLGGDGEWSVRLYGDGDGSPAERPFSLSGAWFVGGDLVAVVSTVGGGPIGTGIDLAWEPLVHRPGVLNAIHDKTQSLISTMNDVIEVW